MKCNNGTPPTPAGASEGLHKTAGLLELGSNGLPGSIPQRSMASLHEDLQRSDAMDTRLTATIRPIQYGINASRPLPDAPRRIVGLLIVQQLTARPTADALGAASIW